MEVVLCDSHGAKIIRRVLESFCHGFGKDVLGNQIPGWPQSEWVVPERVNPSTIVWNEGVRSSCGYLKWGLAHGEKADCM